MKLPRIPDALWLVALLILGSWGLWNFQYISNDLFVIRSYTFLQAAGLQGTGIDTTGVLSTRWSQVAADFVGPWGGDPGLSLYRPLSSVLLGLDFTLFRLNPAASAYINLLIHAISVCLIWCLGKRLLPDARSALYAAMLFAATPLAHENLAWAVAHCGIYLPLSLGATLLFLRRYECGLRGWQLQWPVMALLWVALMSHEQALFWTLFPSFALLLGANFLRYEIHERGLDLVKLLAPQALLIPAYLLLRLVLLGSLSWSSGQEGQFPPAGIAEAVMAPLDRLVESLVPLDDSFLAEGRDRIFWRWLCLLPVILGMMAPLHIVDPRSRRYRRALYLLLGFWLLTRLPNLDIDLRSGLDWSRTAYYSYAPLTLLLGLLFATTRYSRFLAYALATAFAFNLQHRVETRCLWGEKGVQARTLLFEEAERRGAIQDQGEARLCYANRLDGIAGAPVYQPGEMAFALYPPLVPATVRGISLQGLILQHEVSAAAAIAKAASGFVFINPPASEDLPPGLSSEGLSHYLEEKPQANLNLRFDLTDKGPIVRFSQDWRKNPNFADATPVLILAAGSQNLVHALLPRDLLQDDHYPLPDAQAKALRIWHHRAPPKAQIALLLELRKVPKKPSSCLARSQVVFATLP